MRCLSHDRSSHVASVIPRAKKTRHSHCVLCSRAWDAPHPLTSRRYMWTVTVAGTYWIGGTMNVERWRMLVRDSYFFNSSIRKNQGSSQQIQRGDVKARDEHLRGEDNYWDEGRKQWTQCGGTTNETKSLIFRIFQFGCAVFLGSRLSPKRLKFCKNVTVRWQ